MNTKALAFVVAAVAATGCTHVPRASREAEAAAREFRTSPTIANVYVFRDERFGGNLGLDLFMDGRKIGTTVQRTFLLIQVVPGRHKLLSRGEDASEVEFTAVAGTNVFVWQEVKSGEWKARSQLQLVDEARAKEGIAKCRLVKPL